MILNTFPLVLRPDPGRGLVVNTIQHLGHPTEVATAVHTEEKEDWPSSVSFSEGAIQPLVSVFCTTPNFVLDAPVDIVFAVTFHNKKSSVLWAQVEISRVVFVNRPKLF